MPDELAFRARYNRGSAITSRTVLPVAVLAGFVSACTVAQQSTDTAAENSPPPGKSVGQAESTANSAAVEAVATGADTSKADSGDKSPRTEAEALLAAQAAGYKLVNRDGKQVFCKKVTATGSRLATRTRCLTLAQIEEERTGVKDWIQDMDRQQVERPNE